ncbi:hypothetical protein BGX31_005537 [Mortierella sp. GBA43]|nr:hypothetical protein BGX31_005537 [Mortierella sp. GBA43]
MSTSASSGQDSQQQLLRSIGSATTEEPVSVPAEHDSDTGQLVVMFDDIKSRFGRATCVMKENQLVPFEKDKDFNDLVPRRIKYHPGVILDVKLDNPGKEVPSRDKGKGTAAHPPTKDDNDPSRGESSTSNLQDGLRVTDTIEKTVESVDHLLEIESQKRSMAVQIDEQLQSHVAGVTRAFGEIQETQEQLLDNSADIVCMVDTTMNRVEIIRNRIQALLTQTYELHEFPIPRLFIVLPKDDFDFKDKTDPLSRPYRLYFLCECGKYSMKSDTNESYRVHFANHEGYDIKQASEFFETFGPHVLTILHMLKHGFPANGVVVPPFSLVEECNRQVHKALQPLLSTLQPRVEWLIDVLENHNNQSSMKESTTDESTRLLQGSKLRRLESFLIRQDKGRVLGNLNRIVTVDGHIRWACNYHRGKYNEKSMEQLRDVVKVNNGTVEMKMSKVTVKVKSKTTARQVYDSITKAKVRILDIQLEWNVGKSDLKEFAKAMCESHVVQLDLNGSSFRNPTLEHLRRIDRYNPLLEIWYNGKVQILNLNQVSKFFHRVSKPSTKVERKPGGLKALDVNADLTCEDKVFNTVCVPILAQCTSLSRLNFTSKDRFKLYEYFENDEKFSNLNHLKLVRMEHIVELEFVNKKLESIAMTINQLSNLEDDDNNFLEMTKLSVLSLRNAPDGDDEKTRLSNLIRDKKELKELQVECRIDQALEVIDFIVSTRKKLKFCKLNKLVITDNGDPSKDGIKMTLVFKDPPEDLPETLLDDNPSACVEILRVVTQYRPTGHVAKIISQYGRFIHNLDTSPSFDNHLSSLLDNHVPIGGFWFRQLKLNATSLESKGLADIFKIIDHSPHLERLEWYFEELEKETQSDKLIDVLHRHAGTLSALVLCGAQSNVWIPKIPKDYYTRSELPKLDTLKIHGLGNAADLTGCVEWIAAMALTDLKEFSLENVHLDSGSWEVLVKAIGFSALETLSFSKTNFGLTEFRTLTDHIPDDPTYLPLTSFLVEDTGLTKAERVWNDVRSFEKKVPLVDIRGLGQNLDSKSNGKSKKK